MTGPVSLLMSPVARRPEVGGVNRWFYCGTLKKKKKPCKVFRESCQTLALGIMFQVFLLEKGLIWRMRKNEVQEGIAKLA